MSKILKSIYTLVLLVAIFGQTSSFAQIKSCYDSLSLFEDPKAKERIELISKMLERYPKSTNILLHLAMVYKSEGKRFSRKFYENFNNIEDLKLYLEKSKQYQANKEILSKVSEVQKKRLVENRVKVSKNKAVNSKPISNDTYYYFADLLVKEGVYEITSEKYRIYFEKFRREISVKQGRHVSFLEFKNQFTNIGKINLDLKEISEKLISDLKEYFVLYGQQYPGSISMNHMLQKWPVFSKTNSITLSWMSFRELVERHLGPIPKYLKEVDLNISNQSLSRGDLNSIFEEIHQSGVEIHKVMQSKNRDIVMGILQKRRINSVVKIVEDLKKEYGNFESYLATDFKFKSDYVESRFMIPILRKEIHALAKSKGLPKDENLYGNYLFLKKFLEEKFAREITNEEILDYKVLFFPKQAHLFTTTIRYKDLSPIILDKMEKDGWVLEMNTVEENQVYMKELLERIYGTPVTPTRAVRALMATKINMANFKFNQYSLDKGERYFQVQAARSSGGRHGMDDQRQIGFTGEDGHREAVYIDEDSPDVIMEREQEFYNNLVETVLAGNDQIDPIKLDLVLKAIVKYNKFTPPQILHFLAGEVDQRELAVIFIELSKNQELLELFF